MFRERRTADDVASPGSRNPNALIGISKTDGTALVGSDVATLTGIAGGAQSADDDTDEELIDGYSPLITLSGDWMLNPYGSLASDPSISMRMSATPLPVSGEAPD